MTVVTAVRTLRRGHSEDRILLLVLTLQNLGINLDVERQMEFSKVELGLGMLVEDAE